MVMGREKRTGYMFVNNRKLSEEERRSKSSKDNYERIAKLISSLPLVDRKEKRVPIIDIINMVDSGNELRKTMGIGVLCNNIQKLEQIMKYKVLSKNESNELKTSNTMLRNIIEKMPDEDVMDLLQGMESLHLCMAVLNGNCSNEIKEAAEKRIAEIRA